MAGGRPRALRATVALSLAMALAMSASMSATSVTATAVTAAPGRRPSWPDYYWPRNCIATRPSPGFRPTASGRTTLAEPVLKAIDGSQVAPRPTRPRRVLAHATRLLAGGLGYFRAWWRGSDDQLIASLSD